MKNVLILFLAILSLGACQSDTQDTSQKEVDSPFEVPTNKAATPEEVGYAMGVLVTLDLVESKSTVKYDALYKGIQDVFNKQKPKYDIKKMSAILDDNASTEYEIKSYATGFAMGSNFETQNLGEISIDQFIKGSQDVQNGKPLKQPEEELKNTITDYQQNMVQVHLHKEKEQSASFLAENAKKQGVQTTHSGLQYKVIKKGIGATPQSTDKVKVHYHGTLIDGTIFDSSIERKKPVIFGVDKVIRGWTEGIQLMKEGAKYQFFIPYDLAYGEVGSPPIPPFATLLFEVELIQVIPQETKAAPPPSFQKK